MTNPTASASSSSAPQKSPSHLGRGARVGLIVGCVVASLLSGVIIIYMIKKRRGEKKKINTEIFADGSAMSQDTSLRQDQHELPTERAPGEIMNPRSDRTELSDSCIKPPVELDT